MSEMKSFIGSNLVKAKAMTRGEFFCKTDGFLEEKDPADKGYYVVETNVKGEEDISWVEEKEFRAHHIELDVNKGLATEEPSISKEMVANFVSDFDVQTMESSSTGIGKPSKITIVIATLKNGYTITETSSCVSPGNYDEEVGSEICKKKIYDKVWSYLGFLLQTSVASYAKDLY